jgi:hypothetical protein
MDSQLDQDIGQLGHMTTAQLRSKYHELFGHESHSNHKGYLFRRVAWRLQSLTQGGLSERARQYAREIIQDADLRLCPPKRFVGPKSVRVSPPPQADPRVPAVGTVLVKQYKKDTITVTVLEHGFQYRERVYKSLSAIARQVTGTQWNGYCFFGLSSRKEPGRASQ